ncbi:MAG: TolB family protein [Gemmataceae bacterium]
MNKLAVLLLAVLAAIGVALSTEAADEVKLVKPVNLPINTKADEDDPFLSSSGLTLWYSGNADKKFDILMAQRRTVRAAWGKGETPDSYIQTQVDDRGACLTRDGVYPQYLYYATLKDKDTKNYDLYVAVKQESRKAFTEPTPVQATNTEADEMNPWLSADGKQLYFSRKTKDGWRVFLCKRAKAMGAQGFDKPVPIEDLPPNFHHVTLTRDGNTMYLQGPLDGGRTGLFVSSKGAKGWSKPRALTMLNHPEAPQGDRSPSLSPDGSRLYFASDRPGGKGGFDIWAVPTAELRIPR